MAEAHGIRRLYQLGCRCDACTAANTAYSARYRAAQRDGRPLLGAHVAGVEAAAIVAVLVDEGFLKYQIATWLGNQARRSWRSVQVACVVDGVPAGVTVRTVLRLRAIQRRVCR